MILDGWLDMDSVNQRLEDRSGCKDQVTGVVMSSNITSRGVEWVLTGVAGQKNKACVGLFVGSPAFQTKLGPKYRGQTAEQLSGNQIFLDDLLQADGVSKMVMIQVCRQVTVKDVIGLLGVKPTSSFALGLSATCPNKMLVGSKLSIIFAKAGNSTLSFNLEDKENSKTTEFTPEEEASDSTFLSVLKALNPNSGDEVEGMEMKTKLCSRMPELLRK
jgi:hypothetical protein